MNEFEFNLVYGSIHCESFGYYYNGWYCVHGSVNVNYGDLSEGALSPEQLEYSNLDSDVIDIELIKDTDALTSCTPILSLEQLASFIDDQV